MIQALILLILSLTACASLKQTPGDFLLSPSVDWVKSTTSGPHPEYRKVNGMEAILLKDRIIQGNAVDGIGAYSLKDGTELWKIKIRGGVEGGAAYINDRLFFGGNDGQFYSASISTGEIVWSFATRTETLSKPLFKDGLVYFLAGNNVLYALDASNGQQLWLYSRVDNQNITVRGGSTPIVSGENVIVGFSDGYLVALNAKTGSLKWEKLLNKNIKYKDLDSTAVEQAGVIYVLGYDSGLYAVKNTGGEIIWKVEPGGVGSVILNGEVLYYSASSGQVLALDQKTGAKKWHYEVSGGIASSPTLYLGKYLLVQESQGVMVALNIKTGAVVTHFNSGRGGVSRIAVNESSKTIYFQSNEANLYSLQLIEKDQHEGVPWLR